MYICVTSFIVNTLVWARLRSVINRDLISPPRQRRDTTPSGWKTERHPVICIKKFSSLLSCWVWHFFFFFSLRRCDWDCFQNCCYSARKSNDKRATVFSIHGLTCPYCFFFLFGLGGKYHKDKKCFNVRTPGQLGSAAEWKQTRQYSVWVDLLVTFIRPDDLSAVGSTSPFFFLRLE